MSKEPRPFGGWPSQLSAFQLSQSGIRYGHLQVDGEVLYWLQNLPEEGNRQCLFRYHPDSGTENILPLPYSVRSRVHEYGGGDFCVRQGVIIFCNDSDQRLYQFTVGNEPKAITPKPDFKHQLRYADMQIHPEMGWLVAIRERHTESSSPHEVTNEIVAICLTHRYRVDVLVTGADFYAYPRLSPEGTELAWVSWDHPNMPWDKTTLCRAAVDQQKIVSVTTVVDNPNESIYQPAWCPDGELHFVSDRSNWWNIFSYRDEVLNALTPVSAEFGFPQWQFGIRSYQFLDNNRLAAVYSQNGAEHLCIVCLDSGELQPIDLEFCEFGGGLALSGNLLYFIAASPNKASQVYCFDLNSQTLHQLSPDSPEAVDAEDISVAQAISYSTGENELAHGFFYPPCNKNFTGPEETLPPLIVMIHGGPTAASKPGYSSAVQYWTQRGFAVVDVNHRGSTGYGRAYRDRLKGEWGLIDAEDCAAAVAYLISENKVDGSRVAIRGGSAGGYTVYRAVQNYDVFSAGVSRYGVADLISLTEDTHKFELRYCDSLIGKWPEQADRYQQRAPINHTGALSCPMLLLQGDEDAVVPPQQSIAMAAALDSKGLPHHLELLVGEQHGFRQPENIVKALEMELDFYRQVFSIEASEVLKTVPLKHQDQLN